jgi:hypothetical protein
LYLQYITVRTAAKQKLKNYGVYSVNYTIPLTFGILHIMIVSLFFVLFWGNVKLVPYNRSSYLAPLFQVDIHVYPILGCFFTITI